MKIEVTLTPEQAAALRSVPGASAQQRIRTLIRFWQAVEEESEKRTAKDAPKAPDGPAA